MQNTIEKETNQEQLEQSQTLEKNDASDDLTLEGEREQYVLPDLNGPTKAIKKA